eukprot:Gb_23399 [translate_table: standard]
MKVKDFEQNGGIQLQNYIASKGGRATARIFYAEEIEKATYNFSDNMKLGSAGYGAVYKGTLSDGTVVAIKKPIKEVHDQQDDDQFINKVIILSQINHRNVVKLLGCCLETQSPLLVYEYVPNGTLSQHLIGHHDENYFLSWEARSRIAIETAEDLAYLHSGVHTPVIHRDVKSSNILLDNTCTPKVADFGIFRLLSIDQTHVTTNVQGTKGYLDPEYFQTFQLTDKSDVFSSGVVLVELLTCLKPLSLESVGNEFNLSRVKRGRLAEILDPKIAILGMKKT